MWTISELKATGKAAFKGNYWPCVLAGLILTLFAGYTSSTTANKTNDTDFSSMFEGLSEGEMIAVLGVIFGIIGIGVLVGLLLKIFVFNPLSVGCHAFFRENIKSTPAPLSVIKVGFQNYSKTFLTLFLTDLFTFLWTCLFIIPGIIKLYSYRLVPYIISDNPELSATEAITRSREMMNGNKWRAFLLDLSFLGWIILGVVTLGIGLVLWTAPYSYSTDAALYLKLKENA